MAKIVRCKITADGSKLGWTFLCPGCGRHHRINDTWTCDGNLEEPTISPSINCLGGSHKMPSICHSFVRKGMIEFLGDCTHDKAGQTLPLPDVDPDSPYVERAE